MADLSNSNRTSSGVVTFLDVLGWKGVYDRNENAISCLTGLIEGVSERAKKKRGRITGDLLVKSISDTIAIFSYCSDKEVSNAIEIHGELCQWLIPESISSEIPVRGATAFGEFAILGNIFVGKAIDEAAAWHEQADWIGVHLTPSAEYAFKSSARKSAWAPFTPPNKTRLNWKPHCVDWTRDWTDRQRKVDELKASFRRLGPILPEIAAKFVNTLQFVETVGSPGRPEGGEFDE